MSEQKQKPAQRDAEQATEEQQAPDATLELNDLDARDVDGEVAGGVMQAPGMVKFSGGDLTGETAEVRGAVVTHLRRR